MQVFDNPPAPDVLTMNDRYFFSLLDRMASDVGRQPDNPGKAPLQEQLKVIKAEALARV